MAELHAAYYGAAWDFGLYFEAKVATELAQFLEFFKDEKRTEQTLNDVFWSVLNAKEFIFNH